MAEAVFIGVFSTQGMLAKPDGKNLGGQRKQYWFVWQCQEENVYFAQQLDAAYQPAAPPKVLPSAVFQQAFMPEPSLLVMPIVKFDPTELLRGMRKGSAPAPSAAPPAEPPRPTEKKSPFAAAPKTPPRANLAPPPLSEAEELDKNCRAEFAMNMARLRGGKKQIALDSFEHLARQTKGIVPAHKHMFNDFGRDLRKSKLYDLSVRFFSRAVDLAPEDPNARFNLARAYFNASKFSEAYEQVNEALKLDPGLDCAKELMRSIRPHLSKIVL